MRHASQANPAALAEQLPSPPRIPESLHLSENSHLQPAHFGSYHPPPHRIAGSGRLGRKTGRASNRLKKFVPIRCGPQAFDEPGWFEADTVSNGGGSSSGAFLWSLTLTDFHSGWTELAALWGNGGGEVRVGLERIEKRLPFPMLGFDCDNGSEFLNVVVEAYLLRRNRSVEWTRSRAYKKNDQAHVEQKNFTHVRQLLGYGRFGDLELREQVNELYEKAWLPLRNHFTPVMKRIEKQRIGSKVRKKYDTPATPCDRLLNCTKVSEEIKDQLRVTRAALDPMDLAADIEARLGMIFTIVERIEEDRQEEMERAGESHPLRKTLSKPPERTKTKSSAECHESWRNDFTLRCHLSLAQYEGLKSVSRIFGRDGTGVAKSRMSTMSVMLFFRGYRLD